MADKDMKQLGVQFPLFDDTIPVWANQMAIQFLGSSYVMAFYAALPPVLVGDTDEERSAQLAGIGAVPAKCVARVVVPQDRMAEFHKVLTEHMARSTLAAPSQPSTKDKSHG
jgi:hypothetical protein